MQTLCFFEKLFSLISKDNCMYRTHIGGFLAVAGVAFIISFDICLTVQLHLEHLRA
jgi:hypothetical protein